jgi:uncharacterized protein
VEHVVLKGLIVLFASFTMGFAGFGFSLVAVPLLALLMDTRQAVIFHYPYAVVIIIYFAYGARKTLRWHEVWPLFWGATLGLPIGLYLMHRLPDPALKKLLGGFLILTVLASLRASGEILRRIANRGRLSGISFGLVSGVFQGACSTGGPPVVIYAIANYQAKEKAKGVMLPIFAYLYVFLLIPYGFGGLLTASGLTDNLFFVPAMVSGAWLGGLLFKRVDNDLYRKSVLLLLFISGLFLCFQA